VGEPPVKTVDQAVCFVQFASQDARDGVLAGVAMGPRASIALIGSLELVRDVHNVSI
jgi:hypothetical protein